MIIMSATLRTADFCDNRRLSPAVPPLISVKSRQYPVTIHFEKRTEALDYVDVAFNKVCAALGRQLAPARRRMRLGLTHKSVRACARARACVCLCVRACA
jgi:hypothetical protein